MRVATLTSLSDDEFLALVAQADSIRNVGELAGYRRQSGGMQRLVKARIERLDADTSHFGRRLKKRLSEKKRKFDLEEILVENSTYTNIHRLKLRLVEEGVLEYLCDVCGNDGSWLGRPLTLQLDHKNGSPADHRKENLRFLCPNCHSQTETFAGRNKMTVLQ